MFWIGAGPRCFKVRKMEMDTASQSPLWAAIPEGLYRRSHGRELGVGLTWLLSDEISPEETMGTSLLLVPAARSAQAGTKLTMLSGKPYPV